jgi:hypothetical protein
MRHRRPQSITMTRTGQEGVTGPRLHPNGKPDREIDRWRAIPNASIIHYGRRIRIETGR